MHIRGLRVYPANLFDSRSLALRFPSKQIGRFFCVSREVDGSSPKFLTNQLRLEYGSSDPGESRAVIAESIMLESAAWRATILFSYVRRTTPV